MITSCKDIGYLVKTIVSLASSTWDVYSDVNLGLYYYHAKNVTRYMENSTVIPENCVPCPDSNSARMFECLEEDRYLAGQTFGCIFLPSLSYAFDTARGVLLRCWKHGFDDVAQQGLLRFLFYLLVPFPILVFGISLTSLFLRNEFMEYWSTITLLAEGLFEAAPQLIIQIYSILLDAERRPTPLHLFCLTSSFIIVSKCSIELFLCESLSTRSVSVEGMFKHERSNQDSMLKGRSIFQKLWLMAQFSPAFLTTNAFYTCNIALSIAFFNYETYLLISIAFTCTTIPIAFFFLSYNNRRDRVQNVLHYGVIPFTLVKSLYDSRKECFPKMMTMAITRLILFTLILITLMIWFLTIDTPDICHNHHSRWLCNTI